MIVMVLGYLLIMILTAIATTLYIDDMIAKRIKKEEPTVVYNRNHNLQEVRKFHEKFNHPVGTKIKRLDPERLTKRISWIQEEVNELRDSNCLVSDIDALVDIYYFVLGTAVEMGIEDFDAFFLAVHEANMAKLGADGKPMYKPDGKIMKPRNWTPPDIYIKYLVDKVREKEELKNSI